MLLAEPGLPEGIGHVSGSVGARYLELYRCLYIAAFCDTLIMNSSSGVIITTILVLAVVATTTAISLFSQKSGALSIDNETYTAQKTAISNAGKLPIHQTHQVVTVLPPRTDDKVWVGTVTWASSKPIEIEMWHYYNSSIPGVDAAHGNPVLTPFGKDKTIAFTLLKSASGTPLPSGSLNFAASELSFHTLDGSKFTVVYTVDAAAKKLNH